MIHKKDQEFYGSSIWKKMLLFSIVSSLMVGCQMPSIVKLNNTIETTLPNSGSSAFSADYTLVEPIVINNYDDWANYSFISGVGTEENPYIVEGIEIAGNDAYYEGDPVYFGISIYDSTSSVVIRDCYIHHFHAGIYFRVMQENTTQTIETNVIDHCGLGIYILDAKCMISNNHISECHAIEKNLMKLIYMYDPYEAYTYGGAGICVNLFMHSEAIITSNIISNCDIGAALDNPCVFNDNYLTGCGILLNPDRIVWFSLDNNSVNGLPVGFFTMLNYNQTEGEPFILDGEVQQYGQLIFNGLHNVVIKNMHIRDTTIGYNIASSQNLSISDCTADNCLVGMHIQSSHPLTENITEFVDIKKIHILNCLIGFQFNARDAHIEENYSISIEIAEFLHNKIDVFMAYLPSSWDSFTVPVSTKVYLESYPSYRLQVSYNSSLLNSTDSQLENLPSFITPSQYELNATFVHLNHLGHYHILLEIPGIDPVWLTIYNVTFIVVELPIEEPAIGAYMGLLLFSSVGIGFICILVYLKKRRPML